MMVLSGDIHFTVFADVTQANEDHDPIDYDATNGNGSVAAEFFGRQHQPR